MSPHPKVSTGPFPKYVQIEIPVYDASCWYRACLTVLLNSFNFCNFSYRTKFAPSCFELTQWTLRGLLCYVHVLHGHPLNAHVSIKIINYYYNHYYYSFSIRIVYKAFYEENTQERNEIRHTKINRTRPPRRHWSVSSWALAWEKFPESNKTRTYLLD